MELKSQFNQLLFQGYSPEESIEMLKDILEMALFELHKSGATQDVVHQMREKYEEEIEKCLLV